MFTSVLPLRAIVFQTLFLLMAIAIEAWVLQRRLKLPPHQSQISPKQAVQYATTINLLTIVVGWFLFLSLQALLTPELKYQLLNFVFFDQWSPSTAFWVVLSGFITFFASFLLKLSGLIQLERLMMTTQELEARRELEQNKYRLGVRPPKEMRAISNHASVLLSANALSYTAILLILLLRFLVRSFLPAPL